MIVFTFCAFWAGAALGSFLSAWASSWMRHEKPDLWRSKCDNCGRTLAFWQLLPLMSYFLLKRRCHYCHRPISAWHFYMEFSCALLASLCAWRLYPDIWLAISLASLFCCLMAASVIDIRTRLLPNIITIGCLIFAPLFVWLKALDWISALLGYVLGGLVPLLLYCLFHLLRHKDALGFGDIKLFALAGACCGWQKLPLLFLLASISAIIVYASMAPWMIKKGNLWQEALPFGPFICAAIIIVQLCPQLMGWLYGWTGL